MLVELSTHQSPALLSLANSKLGSKLNGHSVKFVNGDRHATQQILHQAPLNPLRTLRLSGREITFANSTVALDPLNKKPDPLNRILTSDNKENPCDLATHSIPAISDETLLRIDAIRDSAERYGGEVVFKFSQSKGAFFKQTTMHSVTERGVCKTLCDHWMACHANGLSLFDGLYVGGQKGQFNVDMLESIIQLQTDAIVEGPKSAVHQLNVSDKWLRRHGLKRPIVEQVVKDAREDPVRVFMDFITNRKCYLSILMGASDGGHAVATYTAKDGEIRFFDPNYGDFRFATHNSFKIWFEQQFWPISNYEFDNIGAIRYKRRH